MKELTIFSGGQTGVDRAALDVAIELGIRHGGYCPRGRRAEDGVILPCYKLVETNESSYVSRTVRNIEESDTTVILIREGRIKSLGPGTRLTIQTASQLRKHFLVLDINENPESKVPILVEWVIDGSHRVINFAGPRESSDTGIYDAAASFLRLALPVIKEKYAYESGEQSLS
jgi:hypothetical protein